jgi:hypothetical protein
LKPNGSAQGSHTVFKRNGSTGDIEHYETFRPQTNPKDPKPWESLKRYDGSEKGDPHFNKVIKEYIANPHVHDPNCLGGVRPATKFEIPYKSNT